VYSAFKFAEDSSSFLSYAGELLKGDLEQSPTLEKRRMRILTLEMITALKKGLIALLGSGGVVVLYEGSKNCGEQLYHYTVREFKTTGPQALETLKQTFETTGWGDIKKIELDLNKATGMISVKNSFEAKASSRSKAPACYFLRGLLEGFIRAAAGRPIRVEEEKCVAKGDECCIFTIKS